MNSMLEDAFYELMNCQLVTCGFLSFSQINDVLSAAGVAEPKEGSVSVHLFPSDLNMFDLAVDQVTQTLMMGETEAAIPPKLLGLIWFGHPTERQILRASFPNATNSSADNAG